MPAWNNAKRRIETEKKSIKYTDQSAWFKTERANNPYFARLNFSSAQTTMRRLDRAFQAFFRRVKVGEKPGYPRFKNRDRCNIFTYPSVGDGARIMGNKLRLQHVGLVRINMHREIQGQIKTISVKLEGGKWHVIAACELPEVIVPAVSEKPTTGIDVGIESFLTTAEGKQEPTIQPLKTALHKLRVEQRSLSRKQKGSNSRKKQRRHVSRLHARVANARRDQHHKIAAKLVDRYGAIAVESLNIKGMVKNHRLARVVQDAGWNQFLAILKHKAEWASVRIFEVSARGTSQTCPACGLIAKKELGDRWHECECGYSVHRDQATAQIIYARGLLAGMQPGSLNAGVGLHGFRSRLF